MKKYLVVLVCFLVVFSAKGQTIFWSDNFNNGCASGCLAQTWNGWTLVNNQGGVSGGSPNDWFVSCAEEGIAPPGCGSSCIGDASLHIGPDAGSGGDMGASYNETGAANATFKLMRSPTINATGRNTITLSFDFIAFGSAACADDRAQLWLSTDNGATWPVGFQYCLTSVCCGACNGYSQGQWTTYTLALPAAFNNNPNVRVGFHWRNNGNGSGTDPSVAVDDIRLTVPVVAPVKLIDFSGKKESNKVKLNWITAAETNFKGYEIERANSVNQFTKIATVNAKGNATQQNIKYEYSDENPSSSIAFYRLKMVDNDGSFKYSKVVRIGATPTKEEIVVLSSFTQNGRIYMNVFSGKAAEVQLVVYDAQGKKVLDLGKLKLNVGENDVKYRVSGIAAGYYILGAIIPQSATNVKEQRFNTKFFYSIQ